MMQIDAGGNVEARGQAHFEYRERVRAALASRRRALVAALESLEEEDTALSAAAALAVHTLRSGHKVLIAGNGGSAAEAQHFAAELVGRFKRERPAYAAIALCTDPSILTAIANDYGYDRVFARQIEALGLPDDLFIAFSTSGESPSIVQAAASAVERGMSTVGVTGEQASRLQAIAGLTIRVPSSDTAVVQELHTVVTHILCDILEAELAGEPS